MMDMKTGGRFNNTSLFIEVSNAYFDKFDRLKILENFII
jgi:hypothetical protein